MNSTRASTATRQWRSIRRTFSRLGSAPGECGGKRRLPNPAQEKSAGRTRQSRRTAPRQSRSWPLTAALVLKMMELIRIIKWFFAIAAGISAMRILTIDRNENGKSKYFASVTDIFDYIEITGRQDGKIDVWFWIFVVSFTFFIALIILPVFA